MNSKMVLAVTILALSSAANAAAPGPQKAQVVWGWGAERLVGTYQSDAQVRPCGTSAPYMPVLNTISFNAGGTVVENARFPPTGVLNVFGIPGLFTRSIGLGSWSYNPSSRSYSMSLRYDFFENGVFYGTGVVNRDIQLRADGNTTSGSVRSTVYTSGGSVIVDLCGEAVSKRF
jgi:hypothetical protein